ncbi:MAG: ABC transporter permease [Anaerolineales bacterium]
MDSARFNPNFSLRMSTFAAMVRKEILILARYPVEFFASFAQVLVIVTVFTLAGLTFSTTGQGTDTTSGVVTYGFVLYLFVNDTLWTVGFHVRNEQIQGTLEQLYLSPASKFASLVARVVHLLIWTSLLGVVSVLVMRLLLGTLPVHNLGLGLFLLLMNMLATFGIGFAFAAITLWLRQTAETLVNFLQFAFIIFGAVFFPYSALPGWMQTISRFIPLAHGVDIFRSTLMGYPSGFPELAPAEVQIVIITVFGLTMPFIGYWMYRRAERKAREKGTLSQY